MSANIFGRLTPRRRPRGRAVIALLPGVFALMLAGVSGVAAAPSPSPSPSAPTTTTPTLPPCHHRPHPWCSPTPSPSPVVTPTASSPTPAPTKAPAPTPKPVASSGGSGGGHSGGSSTADAIVAAHAQTPADPTPFAPLSTTVSAVTSGESLDAARIPPVEALTPLSGLEFGNGLNLGPILLLIDLIGIGTLFYLVRTRWLAHEG